MKKHLFIIVALCTMWHTASAQNKQAQTTEIVGLATPIVLQPNALTEVSLDDYFNDPTAVVLVKANDLLKTKLSPDKTKVVLGAKDKYDKLPLLSVLHIITKTKNEYAILVKKSLKIPYTFSFDAKGKTYNTVQVAGQINDWNPKNTNLTQKNGVWQIDIPLEPGNYQYQLVVDGKWMLDPAKTDSVDNNIGGYNSLAKVGGTNRQKLPQIYLKTPLNSNKTINIEVQNGIEHLIAFWQNQSLPNSNIKLRDISTTLTLPNEAFTTPRSVLRVYAYNKEGMGNDLYIPLAYGVPITDPQKLTRQDHHTQIMYFMMVDRFADGNKNNNQTVKDPRVLPQANYYGGDLTGVTQKIDDNYFDNLGVNTLWVSPLVQNPEGAYQEYPEPKRYYSGYHGYWPVKLTKVDHRFGTDTELKQLVQQAHHKNMNVLLDFVSNHVHQESEVWKQHPDWFSPLVLPDGRKNIRLWDEERLTTWFDTFLPSIDHNQPQVSNMLVDTTLYWLNTYDLDGFRHDAVKHIHNVFWQMLTKRLKTEVMIPQNKSVYQIGETFGSRELIGSYVGSGQLDAQFDFNLYFDARSVFAIDAEPFTKLDNSIAETFNYYGCHSLMGNITGNHDMARFISLASGDLKFNEDPKAAGWTRNIEVTNPIGYKKLSLLHCFITTIPGVPVIYYGDEIGIPGADDPDNRRMMRFDNLKPEEAALKQNLSKLTHLRRNNMALLYGDFVPLLVDDKTYCYARNYLDKTVVVMYNKSDKPKSISLALPARYTNIKKLKAQFGKAKIKKQTITLTLPPYSYEVLVN